MAPIDDRPTVIRPADTPPADTPVPLVIGGFRVDREIGRGGMGVVYAAHDPHLGRQVAVKVMRADWADGRVYRERFLREARAAGGLHHDHIVPVYQAGEDAAGLFLVMPLLVGRPLDARLAIGPVPLSEAIEIGRQAADGLAAAHAAGLVHRDVKPANLYLEDRPGGGVRVRVLDFGVARSAHDATGLTGPGGAVGTPAYMAPEQAWGQPVDHRADLFSLGCVLYHLCAGQPPPSSGPDLMLSRLDPTRLPAPRTVNPAVPPALCDLIRRLMASDPDDRPESAAVVAAELAKVAAGLGQPEQPRRRWPLVAAVGLVAVSGLALAQVILRTEKDGKTTQQTVPSGSVITVAGDGKVTVTPPPADPGKPPAGWKAGQTLPVPAGDYELLFDADLAGLGKWVGELPARKLRPDALSVRETAAGSRFTSVAVADGQPGEGWVDHGLSKDAFFARAEPLVADGFRPVSYGGGGGPGSVLPITFWGHTNTPPRRWGIYVVLNPAGVRKQHADQTAAGNRLVRLMAWGRGSALRYGLTFTFNRPSFASDWAADLSQASLEAEDRAKAADGYRLDALDATGTPAGPAFHAVWVRDGGASDFSLDVTREQFDRLLAARRANRSRPYTLAAYDTPAGVRYAVVWVPMAAREVAPPPRPVG